MTHHMNDLRSPWLEIEPDNIYQKRIRYGRRLLVWITCGLVGTAIVGMVVIGLFAPSFLWTVAAACTLLLLSGIVTIASIVYWAFRSYRLAHPRQPAAGNETRNTTKVRSDAVVDAEVCIIEIPPEASK